MTRCNRRRRRPSSALNDFFEYSSPAAADYLHRVQVADGQLLEDSLKAAYDTFFVDVEADGDLPHLLGSRILVGARTLSGALVPINSSTSPAMNAGFVAGDYSRWNGLSSGTGQYLLSGRTLNADGQNDRHLLIYVTAESISGASTCPAGSGGTGYSQCHFMETASTSFVSRSSSSAVDTVGVAGNFLGFIGSSRNNSANYRFFGNSTVQTVTRSSEAALLDQDMCYFARLIANSTINLQATVTLAFVSNGPAVSDNLAARVTTLVNAIAALSPLVFHPIAQAWFDNVEAAGSVFAPGAKIAYDEFVNSQDANGNLAAFDNGMLLAYSGFTGLEGCFVPLISRGAATPTNNGFVSSDHTATGLSGDNASDIDCGIGYLVGQQNATHHFVFGSDLVTGTNGSDLGTTTAAETGGTQMLERFSSNDILMRVSSSNSDLALPRETGFRGGNRSSSTSWDYYHETGSTTVARTSQALNLSNMRFFSRAGSNRTSRTLQMSGFGDNLPDPAAFKEACENLQTALGVTW